MSHQEGSTVLAIRSGDDGVLYVFGEGVYVGDRPRPGTEDEVPAEDYRTLLAMFEADDLVPVEEHSLVAFAVDLAAFHGGDVEQSRINSIASIERDRARPMAERITEIYRESSMNPCIYLDSGDVVWGFQCWWGPRDRVLEKYAGWRRMTVPVPCENERWK